jgi:hypothetical protein
MPSWPRRRRRTTSPSSRAILRISRHRSAISSTPGQLTIPDPCRRTTNEEPSSGDARRSVRIGNARELELISPLSRRQWWTKRFQPLKRFHIVYRGNGAPGWARCRHMIGLQHALIVCWLASTRAPPSMPIYPRPARSTSIARMSAAISAHGLQAYPGISLRSCGLRTGATLFLPPSAWM